MPNIIATLTIGEGDPPAILIDVRADGTILNQGAVDPADALALADSLGQAMSDPTASDALKGMFQPIVDQLRAAVAQGDTLQQQRKGALAAWEQALANAPTPPPA